MSGQSEQILEDLRTEEATTPLSTEIERLQNAVARAAKIFRTDECEWDDINNWFEEFGDVIPEPSESGTPESEADNG